jgi:S-adenosylmethionine hydrolase
MADLGNPFPPERIRRQRAREFEVVHVDNFGNAKVAAHITGATIGEPVVVEVGGERIDAVYGRRMMECPDGTWVVYPGSSFGLLEIGEVRGPGLRRFDVAPGDIVSVKPNNGGVET